MSKVRIFEVEYRYCEVFDGKLDRFIIRNKKSVVAKDALEAVQKMGAIVKKETYRIDAAEVGGKQTVVTIARFDPIGVSLEAEV